MDPDRLRPPPHASIWDASALAANGITFSIRVSQDERDWKSMTAASDGSSCGDCADED